MKQCEKCGQINAEGATFCANCGTAIAEAQPVAEAGTGQPNEVTAPIPNEPVVGQPISGPTNPVAPIAIAEESHKKKTNGKTIAMIAACITCLIIGIVGIVLAVMNSGKSGNGGGRIAEDDSGSESSTVNVTSPGTKVSYAGYEFVIPEGYYYELMDLDGQEMLLTSAVIDEYAAFTFYDKSVTFTQVENNMDEVATYLSNKEDATPVTASAKTIGGVKFICFDFGEIDDANMMYAISEKDLYIFMTTILTNPRVSGEQYLNNLAEVVKTAEKKNSANKSSSDPKFKNITLPSLPAITE